MSPGVLGMAALLFLLLAILVKFSSTGRVFYGPAAGRAQLQESSAASFRHAVRTRSMLHALLWSITWDFSPSSRKTSNSGPIAHHAIGRFLRRSACMNFPSSSTCGDK